MGDPLCWCCAVWGLSSPIIDGRTMLCKKCKGRTRAACEKVHMAEALRAGEAAANG